MPRRQPGRRTIHPLRRVGRWIGFTVLGLLAVVVIASTASFVNNLRLPTDPPTADRLHELDRARLAEANRLRRTLGGQVWPGWDQADIPLIAYNETHAFLVGASDPPPGWVTVPGGVQRGHAWEPVEDAAAPGGAYHRSELTPGVTPQAFTVRVGDAWAASLGTKTWLEFELVRMLREQLPPVVREVFPYQLFAGQLFKGSDGHVAALLHESFHAFQGMEAPDRLIAGELALRAVEDDYPWHDEALQAAWQTELDLLAAALRADSDAEALTAARQFLAHRDERRAALPLAQIDYERKREWTEGLAKYVELTIWRTADDASEYEPVPALAQDRDFHDYGAAASKWSQEVDQMQRMAGDRGDGRFYYSGMAQAALLDRFSPGWKDRAMQPGAYQEDLLRDAVSAL